jgi:ABC-type transport system substrate-binding protein
MDVRIKEAKKLMNEAGYPNGFKAELICRNAAPYLRPAEFMIRNWKEFLNIDVAINGLENAVLYPRKKNGEFDLMYDSLPGSYGAVPEETLSKCTKDSGENTGKWFNAEYDKLYDQLIVETNAKKRAEISKKMQTIVLKEVPNLLNVIPIVGVAYRPTLHGYVLQTGHTTWSCMDRMWIGK